MANIVNQYGQVKVGVRVQSSGGGVDADAQAFITAASITDSTQQSAINTLVTQLKTYGIWTKMKALYPFVGGTASSHKFNLKDPRDLDAAFRLVFNGGWTHTSTGAKPNGSNGYADTFLNNNVLGQNDLSFGVYLGGNNLGTTGWECAIGVYSNSWGSGIYPSSNSGVSIFYLNGGSNTNSNGGSTKGMYMASKTSSFSFVHIRGVKTDKTFNTSTPKAYSFKISRAGDWVGDYNSQEQRFAHIGDGLTDTEAAAFYTAVQTYQSTLGRNV